MKQKCNETLNIRISKDIFDGMKELANKYNMPYSQLIRNILKNYIEENKDLLK